MLLLPKSSSNRKQLFVNLGHPWICENGVAPDRALDAAVLSRLKQFSAMNKLKKMALRVSGFGGRKREVKAFIWVKLRNVGHCQLKNMSACFGRPQHMKDHVTVFYKLCNGTNLALFGTFFVIIFVM